MNRLISRFITASALFFGLLLPSAEVTGQTTKKDLVGAWTLVSITLERDGKKTDYYGPDPQGQATYEANGRISVIITRSDLPVFASKNRELGTPEENQAVVQGSIAYFGSYLVNGTDKTITFHIESCTFPNWNGIDRKVSFEISGDELHIASPTSSTGTGSNQQVWKRAK